jgi:hypothetical protein
MHGEMFPQRSRLKAGRIGGQHDRQGDAVAQGQQARAHERSRLARQRLKGGSMIIDEDTAMEITSTPKCDEIMLALDTLGWWLVMNRPLEPGEIPRKWPLNGPTDYCPDWCAPKEE